MDRPGRYVPSVKGVAAVKSKKVEQRPRLYFGPNQHQPDYLSKVMAIISIPLLSILVLVAPAGRTQLR